MLDWKSIEDRTDISVRDKDRLCYLFAMIDVCSDTIDSWMVRKAETKLQEETISEVLDKAVRRSNECDKEIKDILAKYNNH